jgi:maleylacetate reductase
VGRDRFREIAEKSMHDRAVLNNPRPIKNPDQVMEILELAA